MRRPPGASARAEGRDERVPGRSAGHAPGGPAGSAGSGGGARAARPGVRGGGPGPYGQARGPRAQGRDARRGAGARPRHVRSPAGQPGDRGLRRPGRRRSRPMKRVAVVVFPGSNCDADALAAAREAGSDAYFVWHRDTTLQGADVVVLPGGFSYGAYLRPVAIARFSPVMTAVAEHARAGGAVLGICNGFQILWEAGLRPGGALRNGPLRVLSRPAW